VVFHDHSPVHDQGFNSTGGAEHEGRDYIFGAAITNVAEINQGDVCAFAGFETTDVATAQALSAPNRRHAEGLACLQRCGPMRKTIQQ
jgi:hypothetical protein